MTGEGLRQEGPEAEGTAPPGGQGVEPLQQVLAVCQSIAVDGEHAAGIADAQDVDAGEAVVDISRQGGDMGHLAYVGAVLERPLSRVYQAIDMVVTPAGAPVAMVHCNTCTSDLDAWVRVFGEALEAAGAGLDKPALYGLLYRKALEGDADCGGLTAFNCYSGEPVAGVDSGCPLLMRPPEARLSLANLMRAHLYAAMAALKMGMDLLTGEEGVTLDQLQGHGGLFKTPGAAQRLMAGALGVPVAVMETAGEGGPWGMALLAAYKIQRTGTQPLDAYLAQRVFPGVP